MLVLDYPCVVAFKDINPLLIRMRMHHRAGAGGQPHQSDDHAVTLHAGAVGARIARATKDRIHLCKVEHILSVVGAFSSWCAGNGMFGGHELSPPWAVGTKGCG